MFHYQPIPKNYHRVLDLPLSQDSEVYRIVIAFLISNAATKSSGLGLGLAMVKSIIQNAEGEITFESEEGAGTTFIIALPVYADKG